MLDANKNLHDQEGALHQFLMDTGLSDSIDHMHANKPVPASHIQGSHQIDYILMTPGALDCVISCGMECFGGSVDSDHRGMFIDFDSVALFGDVTPNLTCRTTRVLTSHIPYYVRKYRRKLHEQLMQHNVYARVRRLKEETDGLSEDLIRRYEAIDRDITNACLAAKRALGKHCISPWSPHLLRCLGLQFYWSKIRSMVCSRKIVPSRLRDLALELNRIVNDDAKLSLAEIQKHWRYTKRQVKSYRKNALSLREDWLYERAQAAANAGKGKLASILKSLQHHEKTLKLFRKLRAVLNPTERAGLMSLWIPAPSESGQIVLLKMQKNG